jgi:LuxR family glucitol operon transcriptional activator
LHKLHAVLVAITSRCQDGSCIGEPMFQARIATRLTCFAILSALEVDLRRAISDATSKAAITDFLPADVKINASKRWKDDNKNRSRTVFESDLDLLDYLDFADLSKIMNGLANSFPITAGEVKKISARVSALAPARNRVCHSRPLEPGDFAGLLELARELTNEHSKVGWLQTYDTLQRLETEPTYVLHLTIPSFWSNEDSPTYNNLPLPEFDDTGFIGRVADRKEVVQRLLSSHPVITIVGEGGVGKTALALRCLYDLLEDKQHPSKFDAIIWISLKTRVLTSKGVEEIRDAVATTLGLIKTVGQELGFSSTDAPEQLEHSFAELREWMQHFRVLLAVDNLETLTRNELRPLLSDIPAGSKILITSRVGLGELESRYKLEPMDNSTAIILARVYARTLNVRSLVQASDGTLQRYCKLLHNSPLLIRWFVSSIAAGADPGQLTKRGGQPFEVALRFCFENLFTRLSEYEREVLHVLAAARRQLSQTELYFILSDRKREEIIWALSTLTNSSMLKLVFDVDNNPCYVLTDFAAEFLGKCAPPASKLLERVTVALKKLREVIEAEKVQRANYEYDITAVRAASRDQWICASYLKRAVDHARRMEYVDARKLVEEAKEMLPNYSEAYRISAFIESDSGDLYKAAEEYETAIRLDSVSTIARYAYALFCCKMVEDNEAALKQINAALELDQDEPALLGIKALALTRLGSYREAADIYESLLGPLAARAKRWWIPTRDQAAECYRRWSEQDENNRDEAAFMGHLARSLTILEECFHSESFDTKICRRYIRCLELGLYYACHAKLSQYAQELIQRLITNRKYCAGYSFQRIRLDQIQNSFHDHPFVPLLFESLFAQGMMEQSAQPLPEAQEDLNRQQRLPEAMFSKGSVVTGRVKMTDHKKKFGFVKDFKGTDWFFYHTDLVEKDRFTKLVPGDQVVFSVSERNGRRCAINVKIVTTYDETRAFRTRVTSPGGLNG